MQQLLLFDIEKTESKDIKDLKKEWEKTRKSLYFKMSESNKKYTELSHELELLKLYICKGKLVI